MCKEKRIVYLAGIGMGTKEGMTVQAKESLKGCDCMIGAKRLLEEVSDADCVCHAEYLPEKIEEYLRKHPQFCRIGIVLSGDAGFYSGAKKLEEVLNGSEERYEIQRIPGISSVVYFAAALHTSWEDAALVSLHGRWQNWIYEAEHHAKTFLLLGGRKENLKEKLLYYGLEDLTVHIGKNFSYPQEQIFSKTVSELTEEDTEGLCIVCLENPHPSQKVCRHLKDEAFTRGNVPMTKEEVRTICIAKLDLEKDAVLYDVGAGTGSVAVEAACQDGSIRVYAIEKNPEGIELIRKNVQKLRTDNVQIVEGTAPEALRKLEPPTHVFIGGSSGNLREILLAVKKKNPDVQIVLTAGTSSHDDRTKPDLHYFGGRSVNIPRILIAAPSSGSGKTVISCGLMAAFCRQQKNVVSCKCGPDYIDPMFHREVLGIDSQNLDLFFCEKEQLTGIFAEHAKNADLAVVEGVMGYYDGMGLDTAKASSYDVAAALQIPVVLVVSARGSALSLAALVKGFLEFKKESRIRGILLNRVSAMLYPRLKEMLENELKKAGHPIKVLGYIPEHEAFHLESRHLGLVTPEEIKHLKAQLEQAGEILSETVDLEGLYELAKEATSLEISVPEDEEKENPKVSIAVARDEAFGFYYKDNLKLLERYGCNLVYFSPIRDTHLPEGVRRWISGIICQRIKSKQNHAF